MWRCGFNSLLPHRIVQCGVVGSMRPSLIRQRLRQGASYSEICAELGVVKSTVAYHAKRIGVDRSYKAPIVDWAAVEAMRDAGQTVEFIRSSLSISTPMWRLALRDGLIRDRGRVKSPGRPKRVIDWPAVQSHYDDGHSVFETRTHFRLCSSTWSYAVKRGDIQVRYTRPLKLTLDNLARCPSRGDVRRFILRNQVFEYRCVKCGVSEWQGNPINLELDHINGVNTDHRLDNLRWLCPNCHSQTPTYAFRNRANRHEAHSKTVQQHTI